MAKLLPAHTTTRLKPARWNVQPMRTARPDLARGLKLNIPLWEGVGKWVSDMVGSQSGTWTDAYTTWNVGGYGPHLSFASTHGDGVSLGDRDDLEFARPFTVRALFRPAATPTDNAYGPIFGRMANTGTVKNWTWTLYIQSTRDIRFGMGSGSSYDLMYGIYTAPADTWVDVVVQVTDTAISLFVDGDNKGKVLTSNVTQTKRDTSSFYIGEVVPTNNSFVGDVALVQAWDRVLVAREIERLYADPFVLIRPARHVLQTTTAITGTLAVTEAADTLAASGTVTAPTFTGTLAVTEVADSLAASGTFTPPPISGTLAVTENADGLVAVGTFVPGPISGTLTLTEQADTLAASGSTATSTGRRQDGSLVASRQGGTMTVNRQEGGPV